MNKKIDLLIQNFGRGSANVSQVSEGCVTCGAMGHSSESCPSVAGYMEEQVNEVYGNRQ